LKQKIARVQIDPYLNLSLSNTGRRGRKSLYQDEHTNYSIRKAIGHFELGGKNLVTVFDDADFERTLYAVVFMMCSLNG
jgi:hypothetical protein